MALGSGWVVPWDGRAESSLSSKKRDMVWRGYKGRSVLRGRCSAGWLGSLNASREPRLCCHLPETMHKVLDLFASLFFLMCNMGTMCLTHWVRAETQSKAHCGHHHPFLCADHVLYTSYRVSKDTDSRAIR